MADNIAVSPGSGATVAADDIGGVLHQRIKVSLGADGAAVDAIAGAGNVGTGVQRVTLATDDVNAAAIKVATEAIQAAVEGTLTVDGSGVTQPVSLPATVHSADFDTGAGTDTTLAFGLAVPGSGGAAVIPGDATAGLKVDLGTDNDVVVTNAGTFVVQEDGAALTAAQAVQSAVEGTLTVDGSGVTQPISAASLPLPTGAATAANQSSMVTALQLIDDAVYVDDADWTDGISKHLLAGGLYQSTPQSITDGDVGPLALDASGNLRVNVMAGGGTGGTSETDDAAFTAGSGSGTPIMGFFSADTVDAGDVGVLSMDASRRLRVSIEVDNVGIGGGTQYTEDDAAPANPVGNALLVERDDALGGLTPIEGDWTHLFADANGGLWVHEVNSATIAGAVSGTEMQVDVVAALPAGTNAIGKLAENAGVTIGDVNVISVKPGTATDSLGKAEDAAHSTGDVGVMALAVRQDAAAALGGTDGDYQPLVSDANGRLHTVDVGVQAALLGSELQVDVVASLPAGDNNIGNVDLASSIPAGTNNIGDVDVATIAAGSNLIGDVGLSGARTSGGSTPYKNLDVDESEDEVKGSAGQVYWIHCMNLAASVRYLKFYDETAANVTVGTTTPDLTFAVPTNGDTDGAGFNLAIPNGIAFGTAITVAATTGLADNDTGAPGANEVVLNLGYA